MILIKFVTYSNEHADSTVHAWLMVETSNVY